MYLQEVRVDNRLDTSIALLRVVIQLSPLIGHMILHNVNAPPASAVRTTRRETYSEAVNNLSTSAKMPVLTEYKPGA